MQRLFRVGKLCTARIVDQKKLTLRGAAFTRLTLELEIAGRPRRATLSVGSHPAALFEPEACCPVLSHPNVTYCAAFPLGDKPIAAKL